MHLFDTKWPQRKVIIFCRELNSRSNLTFFSSQIQIQTRTRAIRRLRGEDEPLKVLNEMLCLILVAMIFGNLFAESITIGIPAFDRARERKSSKHRAISAEQMRPWRARARSTTKRRGGCSDAGQRRPEAREHRRINQCTSLLILR